MVYRLMGIRRQRPLAARALLRTSQRFETRVPISFDAHGVELTRVSKAGGSVLQDKFAIGEHGFIALAMDSEGNRIGLHSLR